MMDIRPMDMLVGECTMGVLVDMLSGLGGFVEVVVMAEVIVRVQVRVRDLFVRVRM